MASTLHSVPSPAVTDALCRNVDFQRWTLFSFSGYKDDLPIVGEVTETEFRLQRRRIWRNDFAPNLYGKISPEREGSRIEVHFDFSRWTRTFMKVWLGGVVLMGLPIFVASLHEEIAGNRFVHGDAWTGIVVFPAMILWGFLLPRVGRFLGRSDEPFLLNFLQPTLATRLEPSGS